VTRTWEDPLAVHAGALDHTAAIVARVRPDQLGQPTPCADWDVGQLVAHLAEANLMFAAAVDPAVAASDAPAPDPLAAYRDTLAIARRVFGAPGVLEGTARLPFGEAPAVVAVRMHAIDHLVHGWDLAVATGQDPALPEDLVIAALEEMTQALDGVDRTESPFGPAVDCPPEAPALDRLVAHLGRDPLRWAAGS